MGQAASGCWSVSDSFLILIHTNFSITSVVLRTWTALGTWVQDVTLDQPAQNLDEIKKLLQLLALLLDAFKVECPFLIVSRQRSPIPIVRRRGRDRRTIRRCPPGI